MKKTADKLRIKINISNFFGEVFAKTTNNHYFCAKIQ